MQVVKSLIKSAVLCCCPQFLSKSALVVMSGGVLTHDITCPYVYTLYVCACTFTPGQAIKMATIETSTKVSLPALATSGYMLQPDGGL